MIQGLNLTLSDSEWRTVFKHSPHLEHFVFDPKSEDYFYLRKKYWIEAATQEILKSSPTSEICYSWSKETSSLLCAAFKEICRELQVSNLSLFCIGKLGANELNLSSDVDLLFIAKEPLEQHQFVLKRFSEKLSSAYRLDFDLRPGGRMASIISTAEQFIDYYGNYGETWERLALIRLKFLCGDASVGKEILEFRDRFCFRRFLDFNLIEDLKILRQKIQSQHWGSITDTEINLKHCLGGIRDVELFIHTLQVIHGGRDVYLRTSSTTEALLLLQKASLISSETSQFLHNHYWNLRHLENLVQAKEDLQTHCIKLSDLSKDEKNSLLSHLNQAAHIIDDLLGQVDPHKKSLPEKLEDQKAWIESLGFNFRNFEDVWIEMLSTPILGRNKSRDQSFRSSFIYNFILALSQKGYKDHQAIFFLRDFLKAIRAKTSFFVMLASYPQITSWIVNLFSSSNYFSQILCVRPELLDNLILKQQVVLESDDLSEKSQYLLDRKVLVEIDLSSEFIEKRDLNSVQKKLTQLADSICNNLLFQISQNFSVNDLELLYLGKWGSEEVGFQSDLDFIFVTETEPRPEHTKVARRFLSTLTETRLGGQLYEVDLRLKPSGAGGVIVSSKTALLDYISTSAEPWELQAYLRARSQSAFAKEIRDAISTRSLKPSDLATLWSIQQSLFKTSQSELDIKLSPGGILDLELFAQTLALINHQTSYKKPLEALELIPAQEAQSLQASFRFLRELEQLLRLISTETKPKLLSGSALMATLGIHLNSSASDLEMRLRSALKDNLRILTSLDPRRPKG